VYALLINRFILEALTEVLAPDLLVPSDVVDRSAERSAELSAEDAAPSKQNVRYKTKDASNSSNSNSSSSSSSSSGDSSGVYWPECTRAALLDFIAKYIELSLVQVRLHYCNTTLAIVHSSVAVYALGVHRTA
jgi:hypothetical protein